MYYTVPLYYSNGKYCTFMSYPFTQQFISSDEADSDHYSVLCTTRLAGAKHVSVVSQTIQVRCLHFSSILPLTCPKLRSLWLFLLDSLRDRSPVTGHRAGTQLPPMCSLWDEVV